MSFSCTNTRLILSSLSSPVRIQSRPHPYSICATEIITEILKREMLQYELTFSTKGENDILVDIMNFGIMVRATQRVALREKTLNVSHKKGYVAIEGSANGLRSSCLIAYEMARNLNFLPESVTWPLAVCTGDSSFYSRELYIPYLNHSTLMKSLLHHASQRKISVALATIGVSLAHADLPYSHICNQTKERAQPLIEKFTRQKSGIINRDNMCIMRNIGSKVISAEEHLFSIAYHLTQGKPFEALFCLRNLDFSGHRVYEVVCEVAKRVRVKRIHGKRIGFGKCESVDRHILMMVNEMLKLSAVFYRMKHCYTVSSGMTVYDIEKQELRNCIKMMIEDK